MFFQPQICTRFKSVTFPPHTFLETQERSSPSRRRRMRGQWRRRRWSWIVVDVGVGAVASAAGSRVIDNKTEASVLDALLGREDDVLLLVKHYAQVSRRS